MFDDIWNSVLREPVTAIVTAIAVPYAMALATRGLAVLGLQENEKIRNAIHGAAENGVLLMLTKMGGGISGAIAAGVVDHIIAGAMDYVKERNPKALKRAKIDDAALRDIITSKIGKVKEYNK